VKLILSGFNAVAHRGQAAVDAIISSALLDTNENAIRQRKIKAGQEKAWKNKYGRLEFVFFILISHFHNATPNQPSHPDKLVVCTVAF
jgi:hypothetical protein